MNRMSTGAAGALFLLYSALNGFIFSLVFELYTERVDLHHVHRGRIDVRGARA